MARSVIRWRRRTMPNARRKMQRRSTPSA